MTLAKTTNITGHKLRHNPTLAQVLSFWGVRSIGKKQHPKLKNVAVSKLWDFFEAAKYEHRRRILKEHPDRGGSWRSAAQINYVWDRTVMLFARQGIKPEGTKT